MACNIVDKIARHTTRVSCRVSRVLRCLVLCFRFVFEPVHSVNDALALTPSTCQRCGVWPVLGSCAASTLNTLSTNTGRSSFQIDSSNKFLLRIACFAFASILEIERGALDTAVCPCQSQFLLTCMGSTQKQHRGCAAYALWEAN